MSYKDKKKFGNIIIVAFIFILLMVVAFLATLSYEPLEIPLKSKNNPNIFTWGDIFKVDSVNEYKYEITMIEKNNIVKNTYFYDVDYIEKNYEIKIFPYEGISKREVDARVMFDDFLYNCIEMNYEGLSEKCDYIFPDEEVILGTFAIPSQMKKNVEFNVVEGTRSSSVYKKKVYPSIKLENEEKNMVLWIVEDVPLPVRMEYRENDVIIIANLENYN